MRALRWTAFILFGLLVATGPVRPAEQQTLEIASKTGVHVFSVEIAENDKNTGKLVDQLMGNKPEARFRFIQERAAFAKPDELDI